MSYLIEVVFITIAAGLVFLALVYTFRKDAPHGEDEHAAHPGEAGPGLPHHRRKGPL